MTWEHGDAVLVTFEPRGGRIEESPQLPSEDVPAPDSKLTDHDEE